MADMRRAGWRAAFAAGALSAALVALACARLGGESPARVEATAQTDPPLAQSSGDRPTSGPAVVSWVDSGKRIKLAYPADWKPKKSRDYELMLLPAGAASDDRRITVDVPDLPPHLPFMIQMSRVEHDYVQDLQKEHGDLQVKDSTEVKFPESTAKLVRCAWHQNGSACDDVALLIIHASGVYILDARTPEAQLAPTRAVFDAIKTSIVWTKH